MPNVKIGSAEVAGKDVLAFLQSKASVTFNGPTVILALAEIIASTPSTPEIANELAVIKTTLAESGITFTL